MSSWHFATLQGQCKGPGLAPRSLWIVLWFDDIAINIIKWWFYDIALAISLFINKILQLDFIRLLNMLPEFGQHGVLFLHFMCLCMVNFCLWRKFKLFDLPVVHLVALSWDPSAGASALPVAVILSDEFFHQIFSMQISIWFTPNFPGFSSSDHLTGGHFPHLSRIGTSTSPNYTTWLD